MQLVEPCSGEMANLIQNVFALLLYEGKHWRLRGRVKEKSQKGITFTICIMFENWDEVRALGRKRGPVAAGISCGRCEAHTLASGKVDKCTRGFTSASWDSTVPRRVT